MLLIIHLSETLPALIPTDCILTQATINNAVNSIILNKVLLENILIILGNYGIYIFKIYL